MADPAAMVEELYLAFNRRDAHAIVALCDERLEFFPVVTAEAIGRQAPYSGSEGLREYLDDVAETWEELLIAPSEIEVRGEAVLVRGRAYARSREIGIRDLPAAWVWGIRDGRFVRGEVFVNPEQGARRFAGLDDGAPG